MSGVIGTTWDYSHTPWTGNMIRQIVQDYNNVWRAMDYTQEFIGKNISIPGLHRELKDFKNSNTNCVKEVLNLDTYNINLLKELAHKYADGIDGLILPGGMNVEPWLYGRCMSDEEKREYDDNLLFRSLLELFLVKFSYRTGKPILGICRGCQLLAVFFGGSLVDVEGHHRAINNNLNFKKGSILGSIKKNCIYNARAFHHQAVCSESLGDLITIVSEVGGVVKAFENCYAGLIIGLQVHPEYSISYKKLRITSIGAVPKLVFSYYFRSVNQFRRKQKALREIRANSGTVKYLNGGTMELGGLVKSAKQSMSSFFSTSRKTKVFDAIYLKIRKSYGFTLEEYASCLKEIIANALIIRNTNSIINETKSGKSCLRFINITNRMKEIIAQSIDIDLKNQALKYEHLMQYVGVSFKQLKNEEFKRNFYFGIDLTGLKK